MLTHHERYSTHSQYSRARTYTEQSVSQGVNQSVIREAELVPFVSRNQPHVGFFPVLNHHRQGSTVVHFNHLLCATRAWRGVARQHICTSHRADHHCATYLLLVHIPTLPPLLFSCEDGDPRREQRDPKTTPLNRGSSKFTTGTQTKPLHLRTTTRMKNRGRALLRTKVVNGIHFVDVDVVHLRQQLLQLELAHLGRNSEHELVVLDLHQHTTQDIRVKAYIEAVLTPLNNPNTGNARDKQMPHCLNEAHVPFPVCGTLTM